MNKLIKFLSFISFAFSSCAQDYKGFNDMASNMAKQSDVKTISVKELKTKIDNNEEVILIDARELNEFNISHIENAIHVGYDKFDLSKTAKIDKSKTVIVYCSVGYRSGKIGEKLKKNGFTSVYNLYGGVFDWKNSGNTVVSSDKNDTDKVHPYNKKWGKWLLKQYWSFE